MIGKERVILDEDELTMQCSKLAVVWSSETTKKFTGQPIFSKIKRLVARGKNNGQPSQK